MIVDSIKRSSVIWHHKATGQRKQKTWKGIPYCLFWIIWKQQSKITFDDEALNIKKWEVAVVSSLRSWMRVLGCGEILEYTCKYF